MIEIGIRVRRDKIETHYRDRGITLQQASLVVMEFERIKLDLLKKKWSTEVDIKKVD